MTYKHGPVLAVGRSPAGDPAGNTSGAADGLGKAQPAASIRP
jgi:hypothetical protein